ncbi:hypothetical protein ACN2WE_35680 [Streptomyces sp. cg28]|uniref:hypothetical protein n=1 Tax=Streptomyces sp. cg28 TaxID=3403457 RepID=UPI003B212779
MPTTSLPQNTDELYEALNANDQRPYGCTRTVTAEELVDAAEQFDDTAALVCALLELQEAYTYGSEPRKSPVTFARILNLFDEQPDAFDERLRHMLFWRFKWVANALLALPEVPLASLRQWLGEMRDRYTAAGLDLQPYYGQAYQLAAHLGDGTSLAYELWAGRTRSRLSDCEACEICQRARFHLAAGDDERALRIWEPVLQGKDSCQEEPARSVSYALLPLLRTGDADRARELHLAGYRACRRNPSMSGEVGRHLEFCALTGNEARGLELLAENRNLFEEVDSPRDQLDFLTGVELLLHRVVSLGRGELPASGYPGRTWTVADLHTEVRGRADDLAARFDARNGTTAHADRRRARLERAPLLDALELTLRTRSLDDVAEPFAPATVPAARAGTPVPESLPELILRARELDEQGHPDADACWARLRTLVAARDYVHPDAEAVGTLAHLRADLLNDEAEWAWNKDEYATAVELYEEAAGLYEDAGPTDRAVLCRAAAAVAGAELRRQEMRPGAGEDEAAVVAAGAAALTDAHATVVRLQEEVTGLSPVLEARLLRLRATSTGLRLQASPDAEHAAAVTAEVDRLHEFAVRHDIATQVSGALMLRASTHAITGDLPAALTATDALLDLLRAKGPAWHLPRTLGLRGRIQLGLRDAETAHANLAEGVRLAADWPARAVDRGRLHSDLAEACMHLGRPDEALRNLTRAAEIQMREDSRTDGYCSYSNAAQLSLDLGRIEDCIALLDSVLAEPEVGSGELDDRLTAQLRLTRARALYAGGDLKAATAEFAALAAESAGWDDDPGSHAMIAAETAMLLAESGEFGPARDALGQAVAAHAEAPSYENVSNSLREVARLQAEQQGADGLDDALALLADAARLAEEARAAGYRAHGRSLDTALSYEHGRVRAYAGVYEDSLTSLEKTLGLLGEPGPEDGHIGEWAEAVRLTSVVEGIYLKRTEPALTRLDAAIRHLTALDRPDERAQLTELAARLRDE